MADDLTRHPLLDPRSPIRKIAVFRALFLGDFLCSAPALRALRARFPSAEITLIGLPWASDLVGRLAYVDRLAVFPGYPGIMEVPYQPERTAAFLSAASAARYDLAIQMHGNGGISNGFVADLGARVSLGYRHGAAADERLAWSLPYPQDDHEVLRWLRLVRPESSGATAEQFTDEAGLAEVRPEFPTTLTEQARAAALLAAAPGRHGPLIGLHAGGKDAARRWPPERFATLAGALAERYGARIVLTGGPGEQSLTAAVRRAASGPMLDLAGRTDLGTFAAVVAGLDLLVTNDTGASHLAAASRTRSVVLFGPSRPAEWAPLDRRRHRPVDALALAGWDVDPAVALQRLPVDAVLEACAEMLENRG